MKKMLVALSAVAALVLSAGSVSAQTFMPAGGTGTIVGTLEIRQALPIYFPCSINSIPVSISTSGTSIDTTVSSFPYFMCSGGLASAVRMIGDWTITPIGVTQVQISNMALDALDGVCSGTIIADVVNRGPSLQLSIPHQSIPGASVPCWIGGQVEVIGAGL